MTLRDKIFNFLQDADEPQTCLDIAAGIDAESTAAVDIELKEMQRAKILKVSFNEEQRRQYEIRPDREEIAGKPKPLTGLPNKPFDDLKYDEVRARILAAIDDLHCTRPQIKRHAGWGPDDDLDDVIDGMIAENDIEIDDNGSALGYFRYGQVPPVWYTQGDRVFVPDVSTASTQAKDASTESENVDISNDARLTPQKLQDAIAGGKSLPDVAADLGCPYDQLLTEINLDDEMVRAIARGNERFMEAKPMKRRGRPPKAKAVVDAQAAAPAAHTPQPESTPSPVPASANMDIIRAAAEDGETPYSEPSFAEQVDLAWREVDKHTSEPPNRSPVAKGTFEGDRDDRDFSPSSHRRWITFGDDKSQLLVAFDGNYFSLTDGERDFLHSVAGLVTSYSGNGLKDKGLGEG